MILSNWTGILAVVHLMAGLTEIRSFLGLVLALFLLSGREAQSAPRNPALREIHSFAFAIGSGALADNLGTLKRYSLVVVDGEETLPAQIAELKSAGVKVLGYLSVGTIERGRFWFPKAKRYRLEYWANWDEWYADLSQNGFRRLILQGLAPRFLAKGFDGLFLDNTDMIREHRAQRRGMRRLIGKLSARVHRQGNLLFAQNGEDVIGPSLRYLDGWNRESVTSTWNFKLERYELLPQQQVEENLTALLRIAQAGLLVLTTDYTAANDLNALEESRRNSCLAGGVPFVSNIELNRISLNPLLCASRL